MVGKLVAEERRAAALVATMARGRLGLVGEEGMAPETAGSVVEGGKALETAGLVVVAVQSLPLRSPHRRVEMAEVTAAAKVAVMVAA